MSLISAIAVFFIIWWLVLFAVLPWGAHSPHEGGEESEPGTVPSAPKRPRMAMKFLATTAIAAVIFAGLYVVVANRIVTLDDIPFLPDFKDTARWRTGE